ncbi:MAG: sulfurtransferase TusA family protein [Nitrospinota bacterium]
MQLSEPHSPFPPAPARTLDLRGEVCPFTWVKTKLALEPLEEGQVLEVWLDHGEPSDSVPRSAASEGCRLLRSERRGDHAAFWIEKGALPGAKDRAS